MHLAKVRLRRCLACDLCHTPERHLTCLYADKDKFGEILSKIAAADLIVYATPVYVFGPSSLLKTLVECYYSTSDVNQFLVNKSGAFFHHVDETICSKPFVSMIVCDNLDPETPRPALQYFRTFSHFMDAPYVGSLVRNGGRMLGEEVVRPAAQQRRVEDVLAAYDQAGREFASSGRIRAATQRRANLPLPCFAVLKRFRPFKRVMVTKAGEVLPPRGARTQHA